MSIESLWSEGHEKEVMELLNKGAILGDFKGLDDKDYEAVYALGRMCYSEKRYEDAVQAFGFLAINNHLEKRFIRAFAASLQMAGHYRKAIDQYIMLSTWEPDDPRIFFYVAECLLAVEDHQEAVSMLQVVVKMSESQSKWAELSQRAEAMLALLKHSTATADCGQMGK